LEIARARAIRYSSGVAPASRNPPDQLDIDAAILNLLDPVGDLHQFAGGSVGIGERALGDEFHGLALSISKNFDLSGFMQRRAPRKTVLMSGVIAFAGSTMNCLVRNISISGAALDVNNPLDIPERFDLVFKADGTHIPCHVIWRQGEQIGVAFD
jgi:hypothetical protein